MDMNNIGEPLRQMLRQLWGDDELDVTPTDMEDLMKSLNNDASRNTQTIKAFFSNAIEKNESMVVQRLIENGVSVNLPLNESQFSPLHFAVRKAQLEIVDLLLEHQADIHAVDVNGWTALHHASTISPAIMTDVLQPLHPDRRQGSMYRIDKPLLEKVISIQDRSLEIFRLLISRGCNVNSKDQDGFTPLYNIFDDTSFRYIKTKLTDGEAKARYHKLKVTKIRKLKTEVIDQVRAKQCQKLKLLLDHGADVETRFGDTEDTILHVLIRDLETSRNFEQFENICFVDGSHAEMIKEILNLKLVDVNVKNKEGRTPIVMAVSVLSADIVRVLVNHGADLSSVVINQFVYPKTPPCLEAVENLVDIVEMRRIGGFPLNSNENLAVLKFCIDCNFNTHLRDYDLNRKFREFLDFGAEDAIIRMLVKIIKKYLRYPNLMYLFIYIESKDYLLKMREFGLPLSQKVESLLMKHVMTKLTSLTNDSDLKILRAENYEMKSLKMTNNDKSLRDVLNLPPNEMYFYLKNYEYKESLRTHYFFTSSIIKGFFTRCLIRRFAVGIANDNLRLALTTSLPDSCCESISKYLTNWDLLNLLKATSIHPRSPKTPRDAFVVSYSLPDRHEEIAINPCFQIKNKLKCTYEKVRENFDCSRE